MAVVSVSISGACGDSRRWGERQQQQQQGAAITLTVTVLMVIALLLLTGPFELARVTWLLSQSV